MSYEVDDYVVISEDFQETTVDIDDDHDNPPDDGWDKNGNLRYDADYKYVYNSWDNLVRVEAVENEDVVVAAYEVYGDNRRTKKTVTNRGDLDATVYYYHDGDQVIAEYNSLGATAEPAQSYVWGVQYVDELLMLMGENGTYFAWQDSNWNVIGLTTPGGKLAEEYNYSPYGRVLARRHTVFGNGDGDGDVDATDQTAFDAAYPSTSTDPEYDRDFDADFDGDVDAYDQDAFNAQFNQAGADKTVTVAGRAWSPTGNPYLYTGRRLDAETGIYF